MGLARLSSNNLVPACRLIEQFASGFAHDTSLLQQLFGEWGNYKNNVRGVLERRLGQIPSFDDRLFRMVQRGVEDIPKFPDDCLNNLTHVEERALDLIWAKESDEGLNLPRSVVDDWTSRSKPPKLIADMMNDDDWRIPRERHNQLTLLQLLTGSHHQFTKPVARYATKDTYVLLNALHSFRNRSQHAGGQPIHLGVAVSAIMLCIELLGCLARELHQP